MTQTFDDIDGLIGRIRGLARQHAQCATSEPPPFAYRERLGALLSERHDPARVSDPQRPRLEELVAASHRDEVFLQRAYRTLMGREIDPDGLANYLRMLPKAGRLYVLAELLCAHEAREYLGRRGVSIPRRAALTLPFRLVRKLGPAGRLLRPPVRLAYRLAGILSRPRLRLLERIALLEVQAERSDLLVRDVLLELDGELQRQADELQQASCSTPALWSALHHHRRAVERLVEPATRDASRLAAAVPEQPCPPVQHSFEQQLFDAYYLAFEDACRGSEAQIREHLLNYQPQLDDALKAGTRALDLGCGRGEWLALLGEQGFQPCGVDLNIAMVEHCRKQGLTVTHGDVLTALRAEPDNSHALISAFHLAEHLPFEVLYALVDETNRILAPGGVLILETPNPENLLVGTHTFYHDPTHRNPLTPTAMTFLLKYHGFGEVAVRRFNPYPESAKVPGDDPLTERVNGHLCGPQDFAVVGCKVTPAQLHVDVEEELS